MNLQEIYQRYGGVVYRRARRLLGDEQAAKDACQEVFLRLVHAMPEFQQTSPVTWLYKVTTNYCLNLLRDTLRRRDLLATQAAASPSLPVQDAEGSIADLLRGFSQELQEVAVYYHVDEMSQDEIAEVLGISQRTVSNRLSEFRSLAKSKWESSDTVLFVYYSGHADADRLHLGGSYLGVRELRDILAGSSAGSRVLVIDACRSGSMTRVKGGSPTPPFSVHLDEMPPPAGFAILTSSAEGEDSQESDALAGSFFTHYFNSGLIGAADQNHDGQVTLAEAFSFASEQTFRATLATTAGPQHPTFRFELGGRQDLILARPHSPRQGLGIVRFTGAGNYILRRADASGSRPVVAEVASRTGGAEVALPEGRYEITLRNPDHILEGTCEVHDGAVASVSASELRRVDNARVPLLANRALFGSIYGCYEIGEIG